MGTNRNDAEKTELELYETERLCESCGGKTPGLGQPCQLCSTPLQLQSSVVHPQGEKGVCEGCGGPRPESGEECSTCATPEQAQAPGGGGVVPPPAPQHPQPPPQRRTPTPAQGNNNTRRQLFRDDDETDPSIPSTSTGRRSSSSGGSVCQLCQRVFPSPGRLAQHLADHAGSSVGGVATAATEHRPYQCPTCPKAFSSKFKLVRHSLIHSDDRQYTCAECERTFHRKDHLKNHAKVHSPTKRRYSCRRPACSKEYSSALSLRKHEAGHAAEEGDLECKMCGQVFDSKEAILFHLKIHAGSRTVKTPADKKYRCDYCDRRFFTGKDVRRHSVVHTGRRDFLCQACPQRFGRKDHLVRHMKKSHASSSSSSSSAVVPSSATSSSSSQSKKRTSSQGKRSTPVKTATSVIQELAAAAAPPPSVVQPDIVQGDPDVKDEPGYPAGEGGAGGEGSADLQEFALPPDLVADDPFILASFLDPTGTERGVDDDEEVLERSSSTTTLPTFKQAFPPPPKPPS